ncbi:HNH endonuclease [Corynebacterium sp. HS2168-gen11]|uniref:HNH endonuclease n=1 Tax=Corynebacterium sp. HS2168-gen11 TaxID=2974027 RepID=UPI00216B1A25|nr:HNH endonuclease signature motif containing protein [Corynebacterium sp. HS2168-gen11]MCS4535980.1 HNH endonuclease [Corynebacterium sp. HS2168-gen11]
MNLIEQYAALAPQGVGLLRAIKEAGYTVTELADAMDISTTRASAMLSTIKALKVRDLKAAERYRYSVDRLHEIASVHRRVKNPEVDIAKLRSELIKECAGLTHRELRKHIRELAKKLNEGHVPTRAWYLRYSANEDHDGMKYLIAKMPAEYVDRLRHTLTPQARAMAAQHQAVSEAEGYAKALMSRVLGAGEALESVEKQENPRNPLDLRHRPCFLLPIKDAHMLETGQVVNSDGVVLDIKELVDAKVHEFGFAVTCFNDRNGVPRAQQVFDIQRLADHSDRFLTIINHLVCQHADCDTPAVRCEMHHIQAFSRGGETSLENLCPLCRRHNLENDDDPERPKHGRVIKDPKTGLTWFYDYKGRTRRNRHAAQEFNAMASSRRMLE